MILLALSLAAPALHAQAQSDADSYRDARRLLNRQQFDQAVAAFRTLRTTYPQSRYVGDSYYWEAYGLERGGKLDEAVKALDTLAREHPQAETIKDARELRVQICGELARSGKSECVQEAWNAVGASAARDDDLQMAAMNALINMPPDRAIPIATQVLANRKQSVEIRKQALFIVADKAGHGTRVGEARDILVKTALDTSDAFEVRNQAVFWLSQVPGDETVDALTRVLEGAGGDELAKQALFALAQHHSPRAREELGKVAADRKAPIEQRKQALFWAAQSGMSPADLMAVYRATPEPELREHLIFLMSQHGGVEPLIEIARSDADVEQRKKALFWLGQSGDPRAEQLLLEVLDVPAGEKR
jgi:HEAT repeat protein